jgi:hypothetical protein
LLKVASNTINPNPSSSSFQLNLSWIV